MTFAKGYEPWNKGLRIPRKTTAEKFWSKVDKRGPNECWPWIGATAAGYGRLHVGGRYDGRNVGATRVAWELEHGEPVPRHLYVCHACDNPSCVNPAHLWLGDAADNNRDAKKKNRAFPANRTHCKYGHEYTPDNTRIWRGSTRICRTCSRDKARNWRLAQASGGLRLLVAAVS